MTYKEKRLKLDKKLQYQFLDSSTIDRANYIMGRVIIVLCSIVLLACAVNLLLLVDYIN